MDEGHISEGNNSTLEELSDKLGNISDSVKRINKRLLCIIIVLIVMSIPLLFFGFWLFSEWLDDMGYKVYSQPEPSLDKPAIYVYADCDSKESVQDYLVDLRTDMPIKTVYPDAKHEGCSYSWDVTVEQNKPGLCVNDTNYHYLFWDAKYLSDADFKEGFCIKGDNTKDFLEEKLSKMGLSAEEIHDFVVYWLPRMNQNEYNLIQFTGMNGNDKYNDDFELHLMKDGNDVGQKFRVIMLWKPMNNNVEIKEQSLPHFERPDDEPYIIEWGGSEVNN